MSMIETCPDCWACHYMGIPSDCIRCMKEHDAVHMNNPWPPGHAEFVSYCEANPKTINELTPFGWFQVGLNVGRVKR
mgnify:CR=1 FL=1